MSPAHGTGDGIVLALMVTAISALLYFFPSIIGWRKKNFGAIFVLNLLLGWTIIGWIVSLVWALTHDAKTTIVVQQTAAPQQGAARAVDSLAADRARAREIAGL